MRHKISVVALLLFALLAIPSQASTWRSNATGNIFYFGPNGQMIKYSAGGGQSYGRWWWVQSPRVFGYTHQGGQFTVEIMSSGAVCKPGGYGRGTWWVMIDSRGAKSEEEGETAGWFMQPLQPGLLK